MEGTPGYWKRHVFSLSHRIFVAHNGLVKLWEVTTWWSFRARQSSWKEFEMNSNQMLPSPKPNSSALEKLLSQKERIVFQPCIFRGKLLVLLGQWLNFKLFGITYLVGKISRSNFYFRVPLAKLLVFGEYNWKYLKTFYQSPADQTKWLVSRMIHGS